MLAGVALFGMAACAPVTPESAGADGPAVHIEGDRLVLIDTDDERVLTTTSPDADGDLVHATLRPGDRDRQTVLVLARAPGEPDRYELRYLNVAGDEVTDLYWFPWRLQVADDLAAVSDVPPVPVWAPDGDAVAWLEWGAGGTRLRVVGWHDEPRSSNPTDDTATYRVADVPAGTVLEAWERDEDGTPVLRGRNGDTSWRIRLDTDSEQASVQLAAGVTAPGAHSS